MELIKKATMVGTAIFGMMRGMGFAVGFSILGAVIVVVVQRLALDHLPVIGEFFAEVVRYVQQRLY